MATFALNSGVIRDLIKWGKAVETEGIEWAGLTLPLCRDVLAGPLAAAVMETKLRRCHLVSPVHQGQRGLLTEMILTMLVGLS